MAATQIIASIATKPATPGHAIDAVRACRCFYKRCRAGDADVQLISTCRTVPPMAVTSTQNRGKDINIQLPVLQTHEGLVKAVPLDSSP